MTEKNNQVRFLFEGNTWFAELNFNYDNELLRLEP